LKSIRSRRNSIRKWSPPSVWKDVLICAFFTFIIAAIWYLTYVMLGDQKKLDTTIVSFFGAIITIAGLMSKQYLLKETMEYLTLWNRVKLSLEQILDDPLASQEGFQSEKNRLTQQKESAEKYIIYVKRELQIIPMIPVPFIILYGIALLSENLICVRATCLILMLGLLTYLSRANITSNQIAFELTDLLDAEKDLQDVLDELKKTQ
jgi:hypothetical protein